MFDRYAHLQRRREFILDRNGIGVAENGRIDQTRVRKRVGRDHAPLSEPGSAGRSPSPSVGRLGAENLAQNGIQHRAAKGASAKLSVRNLKMPGVN